MKLFSKFILPAAFMLTASAALTSCQNDFDRPPLDAPVATMKPNTTIADLKAKYWQDDYNYFYTITETADDEDVIIHGRVISSDATGNIYKKLVIQDETAALTFSINQTAMNNTYRVGQEVVINLTDLGIGKYAGLQQIGGYGEYNGTPQVSFMDFAIFQNHTELNGFPNPTDNNIVAQGQDGPEGEMYIVECDLGNLPTTPQGIQKLQSQLVEFKNVHFEEGGKVPFAEADATTNRTLVDAKGGSIIVRNSNYSSFRANTLPAGVGTVRGILSYFNGTWQLELRSELDCIFSAKGQESDPYTVAEAIANQDKGASGWVEGYIVGSVKANVGDIDANDKIIWSADAEMDNTIVLAPSADCRDYIKCLVVTLPQNSSLRKNVNLADNPGNFGKKLAVNGTMESYMGTFGLIVADGSAANYKLEGFTPGVEAVTAISENFEGGSIPSTWTSLTLKGNKDWYITSFNNNSYAAMTGYKGTAPFESWLITPAINASQLKEKVLSFKTQVNGYSSTTSHFDVYVMTSADPSTATLTKLNPALPTAPDTGYSSWVESGELSLANFTGTIYIGFVYSATADANYATWCVDDILVGQKAGTTTPVTPPGGGDTTGVGSQDSPYTVAQVMASTADATGVWVEGYVVGFIAGKVWASGATFSADTAGAEYTNTNCILADTPTANTTSTSMPAGIKAGATRDVLGLGNNPAILKKHVKVKGDIAQYFGVRGIKNISECIVLD